MNSNGYTTRKLMRQSGLLALVGLLALLMAACAVVQPPAVSEESAQLESTLVPTEESSQAVELTGERPLAALDPAARNSYFTAPPELTLDPAAYYYATIKTDKGDIEAQLFADRAPIAVNNFIYLANQGFYDNTTFHRVLDGFMAQAGDPTGTGSGGPGYEFGDEISPGLVFDRPGLLAMANAGPGTNGSQFFITFAPTDWLNGLHTIFGEVIGGQDVLAALTRRDPNEAPEFDGDVITAIVISERAESLLPTPTPLPPTPTPYPPTDMQESGDRPLAALPVEERSDYFNSEPAMVIDTSKSYQARVVTSKGELLIDLYDDIAPKAVNNLVVLANLGFFDGIPVNQVIPDQVVIIGSPGNTPDSDAGYQFAAELGLALTPTKGALAYIPFQNSTMASSSVMLLALIDPPAEANAAYSFFGQTVEGLDVLDLLTGEDVLESITIEVK